MSQATIPQPTSILSTSALAHRQVTTLIDERSPTKEIAKGDILLLFVSNKDIELGYTTKQATKGPYHPCVVFSVEKRQVSAETFQTVVGAFPIRIFKCGIGTRLTNPDSRRTLLPLPSSSQSPLITPPGFGTPLTFDYGSHAQAWVQVKTVWFPSLREFRTSSPKLQMSGSEVDRIVTYVKVLAMTIPPTLLPRLFRSSSQGHVSSSSSTSDDVGGPTAIDTPHAEHLAPDDTMRPQCLANSDSQAAPPSPIPSSLTGVESADSSSRAASSAQPSADGSVPLQGDQQQSPGQGVISNRRYLPPAVRDKQRTATSSLDSPSSRRSLSSLSEQEQQ
ncbi:hypothetical protein GALMADRAFT_142259 [Galerina marginata CBS 339.88]|uniref:Uncharacterized protein n=1 Tax=Galerina marginata (strain CBS 339.88) TaxID=685588 RepID=A0A067SQ86_GALM3|nr:hypothetical protein GALMADRAFT_142259 [Galerina marginata CBS 339.88]